MKAKKSMIIVNNNMLIGGIQKSLVNLLNEIHSDYNITLFLFNKEGDLLSALPDDIKIVEANRFVQIMGMSQQQAKRKGFFQYLLRSVLVSFSRAFTVEMPYFLLTHTQKIRQHFDYAVSYMQNPARGVFYGGCNEFVQNSINADLKVGFIHCDYVNYGGLNRYNIKICEKFDKIAACSDGCRSSFIKAIPSLTDRTYSVHNCYNYKEIEDLSCEYTVKYQNVIPNLLTVARMSEEKGVLRMLKVLRTLKDNKIKCMWHMIGDGALREKFDKMVDELDIADYVTTYGELVNPYPHFKAADLLVVPSYNEAAPMVFGEAQICGLPVASTLTTSAKELVSDKDIGWVCENDDNAIAELITEIIKTPSLLAEKRQAMQNIDVTNRLAIEEFKKVMEGTLYESGNTLFGDELDRQLNF